MWRFVKIPKIGALVAFALPWMTISCSGQPFLSATGAELVVGKMHAVSPQANEILASQHSTINWYLVIAIALIVVGIALSFAAKRYAAVTIGTSAAAFVAVWLGTSTYASKVAEASKANGAGGSMGGMGGNHDMDQMGQMAASMIQVNWQIGYWITLICLVAAAVMSFLALKDNSAPPPTV